jgi:hypothetical protein
LKAFPSPCTHHAVVLALRFDVDTDTGAVAVLVVVTSRLQIPLGSFSEYVVWFPDVCSFTRFPSCLLEWMKVSIDTLVGDVLVANNGCKPHHGDRLH